MKIQLVVAVFTCIMGVTVSVTKHRFCYDDHPILDGLICYKTCKAGYSHWGGGPICWATCPVETTNIGALCVKKTYGRGAGNVLSTCGNHEEKNGALCYPKCKSGYYGVGPVCWAYCKSGYTDDGALCRKNTHIYSRDVGNCPWHDKCGLCGGPWYNVCGRRRNCGGACKPGYTNDGCTCRRNVHIYAKSTYGRGAGKPLRCKHGEERNGALCYPPCKSKYYGVGPVCWARCDGQTIDTGTQCQKRSYGRGVGKVVNCLKPPSAKDIKNFAGLVSMFKKANGFKNLQAAGCSKLYVEMKVYFTLVRTFNSCFSQKDWHTMSISYAAGFAAVANLALETGIATDMKTGKAMCFSGRCEGVKTDASVGAEVSIGWWRRLDDIVGKSRAYGVGIDIPVTELGISATFITDTNNVYIGTQFSFGVGLGISPLDLSFAECDTPENQTIRINI